MGRPGILPGLREQVRGHVHPAQDHARTCGDQAQVRGVFSGEAGMTSQRAHDWGRVPINAARKARDGPACEKCRHLATGVACSCSIVPERVLEARGCPDYDDTSRDRAYVGGGISGIMWRY